MASSGTAPGASSRHPARAPSTIPAKRSASPAMTRRRVGILQQVGGVGRDRQGRLSARRVARPPQPGAQRIGGGVEVVGNK